MGLGHDEKGGELRRADQGREVVMMRKQIAVVGKTAVRMGIRMVFGLRGCNPLQVICRRRGREIRTEEMEKNVPQDQRDDQGSQRPPRAEQGTEALQ